MRERLSPGVLLSLAPVARRTAWGGHKSRQHAGLGEVCIAGPEVPACLGEGPPVPLAVLARRFGSDLVGCRPRTQDFPFTAKLLDVGDWLSIQVHPPGAAGAGDVARSEAWYVLDADATSRVIHGLRGDVSQADLRDAVRRKALPQIARYVPAAAGDLFFVPAGMVHALGPGLLAYEIGESSGVTHRLFDWGRSQTAQRPLAIDAGLRAADVGLGGWRIPANGQPQMDGSVETLLDAGAYALARARLGTAPIEQHTRGACHVITAIEGMVHVQTRSECRRLAPQDSAAVPASTPGYALCGDPSGVCLIASTGGGG